MTNPYADEDAMRAAVAEGRHRDIIGGGDGMWEPIGRLQFEYLVGAGLQAHHTFLDVGCGSLRAGLFLIPYLNPAHYFGIDISPSILGAGKQELALAGLAERVPDENLRVTATFDVGGMPLFDFGIAQSVFTHTPIEALDECLRHLRPQFKDTGRFLASFFAAPPGTQTQVHPHGVTSYSDRDPYHHPIEAVLETATRNQWRGEWIGDWGHPRHAQLCGFVPA